MHTIRSYIARNDAGRGTHARGPRRAYELFTVYYIDELKEILLDLFSINRKYSNYFLLTLVGHEVRSGRFGQVSGPVQVVPSALAHLLNTPTPTTATRPDRRH